MKYFVSLAGRTFEVELSADAIRVDGRAVEADLQHVQDSLVRHVLVDGRSRSLVARRGDPGGDVWEIQHRGARYDVEVVDERTRAIREMTGQGAASRGPGPLRAPMPGLVTRVEVEAGAQVAAGQGIVIVEAMKMENELRAEADAVVARVLVEAGQAVEKGAILVEFEVPEEE